jgi:maltooligosyltrehalose trehalohydrolase
MAWIDAGETIAYLEGEPRTRRPSHGVPIPRSLMRRSAQPEVEALGAALLPGGEGEFLIWAPQFKKLQLHLLSPRDEILELRRHEGYHCVRAQRLTPETQYLYRLPDGRELPDPASRFQPGGVHGPSQVVDWRSFTWNDSAWCGLPLPEYVMYELHVGTYTGEGTFDAVIPHLEKLRELGITAMEIMPVAQFPGNRNWGYDGVYPFAAQNSYGGPQGFQRLVNAAHRQGLAVVLDVVYNHLGPEGNYLDQFAPYFTDRYRTPWGAAVNFDGPDSDEVRRFFVENALYWLDTLHVDALRLDAIHGIVDTSAVPFLADLGSAVQSLASRTNRQIHLIAESDLNDARVLRDRAEGGFGHDAQWSDDFHHAVHVLITGEQSGYYADFGGIQPLVTTLEDGWFYSGQHSRFRRRRHGNSPRGFPRHQFVVFVQNHDQVGNRAQGDRLSLLAGFEALKLAAGMTLLSPFLPLLFMGEEYGEKAPFLYFTSHSDQNLIKAVRRGRREEFAGFSWNGEVPDPQAESTFFSSKLNRTLRDQEPHRTLLSFYGELLRFRRHHLHGVDLKVQATGFEGEKFLAWHGSTSAGDVLSLFNFASTESTVTVPCPAGAWQKRLDSADSRWHGPGSACPPAPQSNGQLALTLNASSFAVYVLDRVAPE